MSDLANPVHLGASCSQAHLKARECTVLANTLHKAARLQKLWLSKMLDQGLRQQSRQDAQITQIRGRRFGGNSGKHDSSPLSLFSWSHCSWRSLAPPQNYKAVSQTLSKYKVGNYRYAIRTKWWCPFCIVLLERLIGRVVFFHSMTDNDLSKRSENIEK